MPDYLDGDLPLWLVTRGQTRLLGRELSPHVSARLRRWQDDWLNNRGAWPTDAARAKWIAEGHALVACASAELEPDYAVEPDFERFADD